jgi:WD40 repeat protein
MWTSAFGPKYLTLALLVFGSFVLNYTTRARAQDAAAAAPVPFGEVKAVLRKHCGTCHNANEMRGGLDVMSEAAIQAGSDSGPVLVPGKPEESLLYLVTTHEADPKMPPNSPKIPLRELSILRRWIANSTSDQTDPTANETEGNSKPPTSMSNPSAAASSSSDSTTASITPLKPFASNVAIIASALHPDAEMIALAVNRQVVLLNKESREFAGCIDFPLGEVHSLAYSLDGKHLVVGGGEPGASGGFVIYDRDAKPSFQWNEEFDVVQTLAVSPDNSLVAIGSPKRTVRVIQVSDGTEKFVIKKHTDWLTALAFSPDGLLLASGDRFGGLYLWNAETGVEFANLKEHNGTVRGIQFSPTTDHLISASEDGYLRRFDLQSLTLEQEWNCNIGGLTSLAVGSSLVANWKEILAQPTAERFAASRVLVAGRNNMIKLFDLASNPLWEDTIPATVIPSLCMTHNANTIFATTSSASVLCWLNDDHQLQPEVKLPVSNELNAELIAKILSQKPSLPESPETAVASAEPESMKINDAAKSVPAMIAPSSTLAESRKVLAETEDVLKRFSLVASQLEDELEKQEMLRTRDLLRTRIASYRRLMQSLNDYLVELSDTEELKDAADDGTAAQLVQQLKSAIEKDLSELETKLAKVIESMTKVESMSDSENR